MNFRQLRTFVTIAEAGGFARAIGRLNLSQPAASRQIQALEAELGVPLFDRIGRHLQLTSEGEDILRRSRRLLQDADLLRDCANSLKSGQAGTLRVGASPQHIETVLAPFLMQFRRCHPGIEVHFVEEGGARINDRLERGDIQVALTTVSNELLSGQLLYPILVLAVLARSHRLGRRAVIDVSELADEPLLLLRRSFASRGWFDAACHNADFRPRIVLESGAPHTLMALAATGEGVAIVSSNVRVPTGMVRATPLAHRGAPIGRWAIVAWDARRFLPLYAQQFVDELVAYVRRTYPGRELTRRTAPLPRPKMNRLAQRRNEER